MKTFANSDNFENEVISADVPVIADFYSESCLPCKRLSPVLAELDAEYDGKVKFVKIKVDTSYELAEKYDVTAAPTVIIFSGGKELERKIGFVGKDELEETINNYI